MLGADLIDRVTEFLSPNGTKESTTARLKAFGLALATKRNAAVSHRKTCGIEEVWTVCEDNYQGIDEHNRSQFGPNKWIKPLTPDGPVQAEQAPKTDSARSTAFVPLTARYVDAGSAKVNEIIIPSDDKAFSFAPTPVPELVKGKDDLTQMPSKTAPGVMLEREATKEELAQGSGPMVPLTVKDIVEHEAEEATQKSKRAERRIDDWLTECNARKEFRRVIKDAAKLGVGVLKGPFATKVKGRSISVKKGVDGLKDELVYQELQKVQPAVRRIKPWNLFPDPACGEDIHAGDHIFERDLFSPKQVKALKKCQGYHAELIDQVLAEGPKKSQAASPHEQDEKLRYEVFYFYGTISREDLELMNADALQGIPENKTDIYAIVTLINDTAVYATVNPLDSGTFPYYTIPWQERDDYWAGVGIAEQIITAQRIINAATRAMLNNAGAGTQIILDREAISPADKSWLIYAQKLWLKKGGDPDARKAFTSVEIPNQTDHMLKIIEFAFRIAEESTSIPLITQGQSGKTTPDTFGAAQLQNTNANQLLRSIAYNVDDYVMEPLIRAIYEWLLLDPDVPDEEKGDFQINAHGSAALVERAIQDQTIQAMSEIVLKGSAVFGVDPKKWLKQWLKAKHLDPRDFQFSEEEQKKIDETTPPPPPNVQAVLAKAEADAKQRDLDRQFEIQMAQLEAQMDERRLQMEERRTQTDTDRDTVYVQAEMERTRNEHTARMKELDAKRELAILDYSNKRGMKVEDVKSKLAMKVLELTTQKQLAGMKTKPAEQVASASVEPPGRAPAGEAFQK